MASTTTNLGLTLPAYSDDADISDINGNMDLIDAEAGRVRANVAANYDSSETYAVGDYCLHDGSLYKCSTAISSPEAWTAGHWTQIKITGELSTLNGKITTYRAWHYVNKIDNASGTVAMPSNCNEILLLFNISDTIQMTLVIPYIAFVASDRSFRTGYYSSSSYQASGVITGNTEGFRNLVLYLNGQTVSLSASNYCSIYYR